MLFLCAPRAFSDEARERVARVAAGIENIQAAFEQKKNLSMFRETLVSSGRFAYARPDRLRWELLKPVKSGFVLRGSVGERWHEMLDRRETFSVDRDPVMRAVSEQLMAWASADFKRLEAQYEIATLKDSPARFRLVPRSALLREQLDSIEVSFASGDRYVEEVLVREKNGDSTRLTFTGVQLNAALPAGTF
jgi:outer membrane lipoprotein-sorting protein